MRRSGLSDVELRSAAVAVRKSMLASLPEPEECVHEFSDPFHEKMDALFRWERRRDILSRVMHRVAAVLAVFLLGSGIWICVDAEARAAFFGWVREVYENSIIYKFNEKESDTSLPVYRPQWLPEGVNEDSVWEDDTICIIIYKDADGVDALAFNYQYGSIDAFTEFIFDSDYEHKVLEINGCHAELHLALDDESTSNLVWFDEERGIFFSINSYFSEDIILTIAGSVKLTK